jgi:environmental stress-induced protein Ves
MASPVELIRFVDYPVVPWRNGRGVTREVATVDAREDGTFGWRLSMAEISGDAPFSVFAGIERHLVVVAGGPLEIVIAGEARRIEIGGAIATFAGNDVVSARPLGGTVTDLNLMVDPSKWVGSLEMVLSRSIVRTSSSTAVVALDNGLRVRATDPSGSSQDFQLEALDCLLVNGPAALAIESGAGRSATDPVAVLVMIEPRSG